MVSGMETNNNANNDLLNADTITMPSPQSVGREFVRQYYTILNMKPNLLHRFYSDDSYFVNGSLDRAGEVSVPVFGQENINKKIMSLNFKDCHAKIRQVDAMETIGKGVVIQVSGELSNDGQPMRKFLQTFVLAPQSLTKYYVKNDIFRYQDDIFVDDDDYSEVEKSSDVQLTVDKKPVETHRAVEEPIAAMTTIMANVGDVREVNVAVSSVAESTPVVPPSAEIYSQSNGLPNESVSIGGPVANIVDSNEVITEEKPPIDLGLADPYGRDPYPNEDVKSGSPLPPPESVVKSYANMAAKSASYGYSSVAAGFPPPKPTIESTQTVTLAAPYQRSVESSPIPSVGVVSANTAPVMGPPVTGKPPNNVMNNNVNAPAVGSGGGLPPRDRPARDGQRRDIRNNQQYNRRNDSREMTPGRTGGGGGGPNDSDDGEMREKKYPDENQVFVGNLPQNISEDNLGEMFGKYGKIIDVRINRQNQKSSINLKTPNYGFVTFETPDTVQKILQLKPIYFDNHRFNVEEKRSQSGRGSMSFDRNARGGPGGPPGMSGGGGGGPPGGRMNSNNNMGNMSGMRPQNDRPIGGRDQRPRTEYNQSRGGPGGPRGGGMGPGTGGGPGSGRGFPSDRNTNSFNNRQNR